MFTFVELAILHGDSLKSSQQKTFLMITVKAAVDKPPFRYGKCEGGFGPLFLKSLILNLNGISLQQEKTNFYRSNGEIQLQFFSLEHQNRRDFIKRHKSGWILTS